MPRLPNRWGIATAAVIMRPKGKDIAQVQPIPKGS